MKFASLHNHCHYSLDGVGDIPSWVKAAKEADLSGLAITDHGMAGSMLELYDEGKKQGLPVVLGSEVYVADDLSKGERQKLSHLILWVKNAEGYKNLCRLSTMSFDEDHFYYKPRLTLTDIFEKSQGLMVSSACIASPLARANAKSPDLAIGMVNQFKEVFGEDFYLEIMPVVVNENGVNVQEVHNRLILDLANKTGVKVIATSDAHMPDPSYKLIQDVKLENQSRGWRYDHVYSLLPGDDMVKAFFDNHSYLDIKTITEALANTVEIVEKTKDLTLEFKPLIPKPFEGNSLQILSERMKKYDKVDFKNPEYASRLVRELKVVHNNPYLDLVDYFLVLDDIVHWCQANGVLTGMGRGSAAGSLLSYALEITKIDPIKYELSFARFLNEARLKKGTLPDIDLDVADRDAVIKYLRQRYGSDKVVKFGTVSVLKVKSAIKDIMRGLLGDSFDYVTACKITKLLPKDIDGMEPEEIQKEIKNLAKTNEDFKKAVDSIPEFMPTLLKTLGQARQLSVHASAVAITPIPLQDIVPMARRKEEWFSQYSAHWMERAGVVKFDILTINTLQHMGNCFDLVQYRTGIKLEMDKIPVDDPATFETFRRADTDSVFQFNSDIAKGFLNRLPVATIDDLSQITAIGRPGPMGSGMDQEWAARFLGQKPCVAIHPALEPVLKDTRAVLTYQEQVMKALQVLAGFSDEEADDIRRAMGKKDSDLMQSYRSDFANRAVSSGTVATLAEAEDIWHYIESFSEYAFNKCLCADTLVETLSGNKLICEVKTSDLVRGWSKDRQEFEWVEVKDVINQGVKEVFEVITESGCAITCTLDHKFLCEDGLVRPLQDILMRKHKILCDI